MQRVYRTVDLLEAHIIVDFLRGEGIRADVFDADFVRQDWLAALAYGGYRIVVDDDDADAARRLIGEWRENRFALDADEDACPRCGSRDVREDAAWRRAAWAVLFLFSLPVVPFKRRRRCAFCANRWKAPETQPFRDLARQADAAERAG